uniref:Uncharacterized protein n=1 Tax=Romanomermis culicivorax TaxID=13658 RepID=A0A915ILV3_ROMCU
MDVDQSKIAYVPWNLASYKDEIGFAIQYKTIQMEKIMLLRTKPALIQCREVIIGPMLLLTFGLDMLRLLNEKHESLSPNFLVVAKPAHGRLIVGSQVYGPNDTANFSYSDLKNGRLQYRCNYREVRNVLYDFFRYEFQMEGMQPAQSRFAISIHPDVSMVKVVPAEAGFSDFDTNNNNDRSSKQSSTVRISSLHPNITHDHSVIVLIAVPTLLVGLMIIVIRRVRIGNKRQRRFKREKEELQRKMMNAAMTREVPILMSNKRSHSDLMSFGSTIGTTKVGSPSLYDS